MDKRILITGITGFLGYELAERCLKEGYEVAGIIRQHPQTTMAQQKLSGKVKMYEGDITDIARLRNILRDFDPDYIAHFAALTRVSYSFDHIIETMRTNLEGTVNMVLAAQSDASNIKRFLFSSSVETYGQQDLFMRQNIPLDEKTLQQAGSPYGVWKIGAEAFIKQQFYEKKFPGICFRQTNCYGRKFDDYFVVEAFVTSMLKNKDVVNFGSPEPIRAFIYIDDLIDMYMTILSHEKNDILGHSFTTGPPNGITIGQLAKLIAKKLEWHGEMNWYTREIRHGEIFYLNTDNKKITEMTGWKPKISLDEGLDKVISYWKDKINGNL